MNNPPSWASICHEYEQVAGQAEQFDAHQNRHTQGQPMAEHTQMTQTCLNEALGGLDNV